MDGKNDALAPQLPAIPHPHGLDGAAVVAALQSSVHGLGQDEAARRLRVYGRNTLPRAVPLPLIGIFLRQFLSPLIYVLLIAAVVSLFLEEWSDAGFIFAVLLINATIGTTQEFSAQRSAEALRRLVTTRARVLREGEAYEIDAEALVPGDIVLLESGSRVPADLRLLDSHGLTIDESLLTGESLAVSKESALSIDDGATLGDRLNMAFAATLVNRGRGRGVVVATGLGTEIGTIAASVLGGEAFKPPLLLRMERFTLRVAIFVGVSALLMAAVAFYQGTALNEVFLMAVALAVSAIPEGLPVALTVALAIGMARMAKRNVIVRRLVAVEALGSCTIIASDKTGTLTVNELTVRRLLFPGQEPWEVSGEGMVPEGTILPRHGALSPLEETLLKRLCLAVTLCNESFLGRRNGAWTHHGDSVDVALLVLAHKAGITLPEAQNSYPQIATIPFEAEHRYAASLNRNGERFHISVKGALESLLPMCTRMAAPEGDLPLDPRVVEHQAQQLAADGYRLLAVADGTLAPEEAEHFSGDDLHHLTLLGVTAMIDPLRPSAKAAIAACRRAGIEVCMITGDHPATALAIARELELADSRDQVVTGSQLKEAEQAGPEALAALAARARLFARVEPQQKLDIVRALQQLGHFVAVTGDGANDAPALKAAHVGVAMGRMGTDVAKESADLVVTDDNFASIVAGVEEGRVAYSNVRKVIFLLISTGAAEIVLFILALLAGLPLPLLAVQLLWLNLVTNGIQDVALAFEPAEGDELQRPPRPPREAIFNRLMIERVVISALFIGTVAFATFQWLLAQGHSVEESRNALLLLMVLFENVHVFNCRSELRSALRHSPMRNRLLLLGTVTAQLVHIGAMYTPVLNQTLGIEPVALELWLQMLGLAIGLLAMMELHKLARRRWPSSA